MEVNLAQELVSVDQDSLLLVLLDLRKAYDNLYQGWILRILEGYGAGPKMQTFWHSYGLNRMGTMVTSSRRPT